MGFCCGFCHGDLHGANAGTLDGVVTLYDFDCCGWGFRAYDLAVFPWAFAAASGSPERIEILGRAFLIESNIPAGCPESNSEDNSFLRLRAGRGREM